MSGPGRRGRRGGRRQRRREEQARQQAAQTNGAAAQTNGQSGPGHPVLPAPVVVEPVVEAARALEVPPPVAPPAPAADPPHPRPMSARELVARLEAKHAQEAHAEAVADQAERVASENAEVPAEVVAPGVAPAAPRRFTARGAEWLASVAGRGSGGTGRVAQARIEAIRFAPVSEPESVAAEVIVPRVRLDDLYDDELAELLERGLRSRGNG